MMQQRSVFELFRLEDQVAVLTGASAGLGYDMACALAEAGSAIVITSRQLPKAEAALESIREAYHVDTLALQLDQRDHEQVRRMAEAAHAWKGRIDILVNNAGGGSGIGECNLLRRDPEAIRELIDSNLVGSLFCCQEVARYMVKARRGKIINVASIAGIVGRDRRLYRQNNRNEQPIDYAAAKGGVIAMTRDLAGLLSPDGVYVNSISPGGMDNGSFPAPFLKAYNDRTMLGRMGALGRDLKGVVLFLASAASDYVTGHNLVVDGGFTVWK